MMRWIYAGAASLALIGAGLVHGYWTDRWTSSSAIADSVVKLANVPHTIGDWKGEDIEVKPGQAGPGVAGCVQRAYENRARGMRVVIALVLGRPGPVSIHTPDACYAGSGYKVNDRALVRLDTERGPAQFWKADAVKTKVSAEQRLRIYWGWNGGDGWQAPTNARQVFPRHRYPVLHKLYVLRDLEASNDAGKEEACEAFLRELLPALQDALFEQGS